MEEKPSKPNLQHLSRRERQIMDAVFRLGKATAAEIVANIPDPPTRDAVRRMIRILEEKGFLTHEEDGPRYIYKPTVKPEKAQKSALDHVVQTYFKGSVANAIASLLESSSESIPDDELETIVNLIEKANREGQ